MLNYDSTLQNNFKFFVQGAFAEFAPLDSKWHVMHYGLHL